MHFIGAMCSALAVSRKSVGSSLLAVAVRFGWRHLEMTGAGLWNAGAVNTASLTADAADHRDRMLVEQALP